MSQLILQEVATVDDDNGDNDDDSIVEIGEGDSDIVSVDSGESEPEEIVSLIRNLHLQKCFHHNPAFVMPL